MSATVFQPLARAVRPGRRPRFARLASTSAAASNPLAGIRPGEQHRQRLVQHYETTLAPALLYMTYDHYRTLTPPVDPATTLPRWDSTNPYTKNRPARPTPGNRPLSPMTRAIGPDNVVRLDHVVVSTHVKDAAKDKDILFAAIMGLEAMTGETEHGQLISRHDPRNFDGNGIEVTKTRRGSASFKIRGGQPIGAKVVLRGDAMYTFLETLGEFVLPRLKDFGGVPLPNPSTRSSTIGPSAEGGTVTVGFPAEAMGLFPAIEVNSDSYPKLFGFHVNIVTTARGKGSQDQARSLLSGLIRLPFVKKR
jgi:large subunit ribosomal protein L5